MFGRAAKMLPQWYFAQLTHLEPITPCARVIRAIFIGTAESESLSSASHTKIQYQYPPVPGSVPTGTWVGTYPPDSHVWDLTPNGPSGSGRPSDPLNGGLTLRGVPLTQRDVTRCPTPEITETPTVIDDTQ